MGASLVHILTGATGFVGSHLVARLLDEPAVARVYALARSRRAQNPKERLAEALAVAGRPESAQHARLVALDADVLEPDCGVSRADIAGLSDAAGTRVFWHVAASLQWTRGQRSQVFATNVDGTRHALSLARQIGADVFVYVSTSYTCGSLIGAVPEALHNPPRFNNVYEESKHAAEHYLMSQDEPGPRVVIVRPSIIVGSSVDYQACGSDTGLYGFLTELRRFRKLLGDSKEVVRLAADPTAILSFVPIDHVISDAMEVVRRELSEPAHQIYHLTSDTGPELFGLMQYAFEGTGLGGRIRIVEDELGDPTPLERFFAKRMEFFSGYIKSTKRFERRLHTPRSLSLSQLERFMDSELAEPGQ